MSLKIKPRLNQGLFRKAAAWFGVLALLMTALPMPVDAAQITARKTTLGSSVPGASTTYAFSFTTSATAYTIRAIKFQVCDSPLQAVSCVAPASASIATATLSATSANLSGATPAFAISGTQNATQVIISSTGGISGNAAVITATFSGVTNPNTANTQFYTRITTYTDAAASLPTANGQDFGGTAVSTAQQLSVTANVQEDLTFCVGTSIVTNCGGISGSTVTLTPNPMGTSAASKGSAVMAASTNGTTGYVITYTGTSFTNTTADTITAAATGGAVLGAGGTEQFGFNLAANTGGNFGTFGAAPSGGSGTATAPYATNNSIAYNTAGGVQVASAAGPTALTTFTMSFGANVANTTKPGAYTATQTFIATATF